MLQSVTWQYILILPGGGSSQRIARRRASGEMPFYHVPAPDGGGTIYRPDPPNTWSMTAPGSLPYHDTTGDKTFVFAYWSIAGHDTMSTQSESRYEPGTRVSVNAEAGSWTYTVRAFYVWNFAGWGGEHYIYIDAVDEEAFSETDEYAGFLADDFVDVAPDPHGTRSTDANNGFMDTSILPQGATITITARDGFFEHTPPGAPTIWLQFDTWGQATNPDAAPLLGLSGDPHFPLRVGQAPANPDQILAHRNDIAVAWAFYKHGKAPTAPYLPVLPILGLVMSEEGWVVGPWNPHSGGIRLIPPWNPGGPPSPFGRQLQQHIAALAALADAASNVPPALQARVLELTVQQLSLTSALVQGELEKLQEK